MLVTYSDGTVKTVTEGFKADTKSFDKPGVQTVTVSYQNAECRYPVTVLEPVKKIEIVPLPTSISLMDTPRLSVGIYPSFAQASTLIWKSSDESVLTVSEDGVVTAKKRGSANVTVTTADGSVTSTITITVVPKSFTTTWLVDGKATEIAVEEGSAIPTPADPVKEGYSFSGWSPEVPATMPAKDLTFTAQFEVNSYTVTWVVDGKTTSTTVPYGDAIMKPNNPTKDGYTFKGWTPAVPTTMPAKDMTFDAVFEKIPDPIIKIHNFTSSRTVDYRTTITFSTDEIQNPVDGASVHWFINGQDKGASDTYTEKEAKKDFTVQAKYMKDGKVLAESEIETVKVKAGFFARLKAFFRALFGRLPKVVQEYLGVELIDRVLL